MRWADERYVRLYTRDTVAWRLLPWQAKAIWPLILRKLDRAGLMPLEGHGAIGLAAMIEIPIDVVNVGLPALLADGCLREAGDGLVAPNFIEAQEAAQSDAQRKREQRARARETATGQQTIDTFRDAQPDNRHAASQSVTPCLAVPSLAVPSRAVLTRSSPAPARDPMPAQITTVPESDPAALSPASPPDPPPALANRDWRRGLEQRWIAAIGVAESNPPGLCDLADQCDLAAPALGLSPAALFDRAVAEYRAYRETCSRGRAPALTPRKIREHWVTVVERIAGTAPTGTLTPAKSSRVVGPAEVSDFSDLPEST